MRSSVPEPDEPEALVDYESQRMRDLATARGIDWDDLTEGERDRLVAEWNEIGQMPKARFRQINEAWSKALKAFDASETRAEQAQWNDYLDQLVAQAARLDALEHALCAGEEVALDDAFSGLFADRVAAIGNGARGLCDAFEKNLERRNQLMLEAEVLLELETPRAFADQRRQWQLEHLSDAMTGGLAQSPREQALAMLEKACRTGAVPETGREGYLQRQGAIVAALRQ